MPRRSSTLLSAKMLRASSSTSSTVRSTRSSSELFEPLQHALLFGRQVGHDAMQEQRGLVEQPLGRFDAFDHDAARHGVEVGILLGAQLAAGEHDDRHVGQRVVGAQLFQHFKAGHVGQAQIEHDAVGGLSAQRIERVAAGAGGLDLDVVIAEQFARCSSARRDCPRRPADACAAASRIP